MEKRSFGHRIGFGQCEQSALQRQRGSFGIVPGNSFQLENKTFADSIPSFCEMHKHIKDGGSGIKKASIVGRWTHKAASRASACKVHCELGPESETT